MNYLEQQCMSLLGLKSKVYAYSKEGDDETKAKKKLKVIKTNIATDKNNITEL